MGSETSEKKNETKNKIFFICFFQQLKLVAAIGSELGNTFSNIKMAELAYVKQLVSDCPNTLPSHSNLFVNIFQHSQIREVTSRINKICLILKQSE